MALRLNSTGGGSVTLDAPSTPNTYTVTLPATNQTLGLTSGTAATASGTAVNFTGIPSWVKRITVMFSGVSTSGTSNLLIQLGTGSTPTYANSGYQSSASVPAGSNISTAGIILSAGTNAAVDAYNGFVTMCLFSSGNAWVSIGSLTRAPSNGNTISISSLVSLGGALTAVRITTVNGTDTFDAGTINIMYEG